MKSTNILTGKKTIYIHQNSGIPLIGSNAFGLVDRGTNIIEVKPITGCNFDCIYCSVTERKRIVDIVVEKDYLIKEFEKLVNHKQCNHIEAHIAGQAEPTLYADLIELISELSDIPEVKIISIDTNGSLLTEKLIDKLINAGLNRVNFSLNAMDNALLSKMAGADYDINKTKKMIEYIAKKIDIVIAPVLVPGYNDNAMEEVVRYVKHLKSITDKKVVLGIQNFLNYKHGRNPVKAWPWEKFFNYLKSLEQKTDFKLILDMNEFFFKQTKPLPNPFKKDEVIRLRILEQSRLPNEYIGALRNRNITIIDPIGKKREVKARVIRTKDNIIYAKSLL